MKLKQTFFISLLILTISAQAMESPEAAMPLEHAAPEIKQQILLNVATGSTAKEAIQNLLHFTQVSRAFAPFLNDEYTNTLLIRKLAKNYYNGDFLKAALELNTQGARQWMAKYLADEKAAKEARTPLFKAIYANNTKAAINLINAGLDANTTEAKLSRTPLMAAANNGNIELINFLLSKGAIIDKQDNHGMSALLYAIRAGKFDATKLLIDKGASISIANASGFTPLIWAIHKKHPKIAQYLIENNANVNISDKSGVTPLMEAAAHNIPEILQILIQKGANINAIDKKGYTALINAALEKNSSGNIKMLLQAGANPVAQTQDHFTALMAAAESNDPENVKLLLNTPARSLINQKTQKEGFSALLGALFMGNIEITNLLLQAGADSNIQDNHHYTPLMHAATFTGNPEFTDILLRAGANPNIINDDVQTALHIAVNAWNTGAVRALLQAGADKNMTDANALKALQIAQTIGDAVHEIIELLQ